MTHDEAFLADIAEHPADDAPRLIYADWLEEHGGAPEVARAAFIRGQCRLARMSVHDPARAALEDECSDLLAEHEEEWTAPVRGIAQRWGLSRGFIDRIELRDDVFLRHAEALAKQLPLRTVAFQLSEKNSKALASCRHLERLETLEIRNQNLRDLSFKPLLTSEHLKRLTGLNLAGNSIAGPAIEALLQGKLLARLRRLDLGQNSTLGDRAVRALVTSRQLAGLEVLRLGGANLTTAGLQEVFAARSLPRLAVLDIGTHSYGSLAGSYATAFLASLTDSPLLPRLLSLDFSGWLRGEECASLLPLLKRTRLSALHLRRVWMTCREARLLAGLPQLSTLTTLDLTQSRIEAMGAGVLADSQHLANLTTLDLRFNAIRDRGAIALASSPHLRCLQVLHLRRNGIGGTGASALAQSPNLHNLRWLNLAGNSISTASVEALARSSCAEHLASLDLSDTGMGPDSARTLAQHSRLKRLERLFLDSNDLGDEGAALLASSPTLQRLKLLHLRDNGMGKAGTEALVASRHLGRLRHLDVWANNLTNDEVQLLRRRFGAAFRWPRDA